MYLLKVNLLVGFFLIALISVVQSQTKEETDEFTMGLRNELGNTLPSLLKNISVLYRSLNLEDGDTAEVYINTLNVMRSLISLGPSHAEAGAMQKRDLVIAIAIKDVESFIDFIVLFIVRGLLFGVEALLTPIIVLVQVLLFVVAILLNIVLWIVRALLVVLLGGLGGLGVGLATILGDVQVTLDNILADIEKLLGDLTILKS